MKLALSFAPGRTSCAPDVHRMLVSQALHASAEPEILAVDGGALGYLPTSERFSRIPVVRRAPNGNVLLVSGVPVDEDGRLEAKLAAIVDGGDYLTAARGLAALDGAFAAVLWVAAEGKLVVVTDFLGFQPLYERQEEDNGLAMATEIKGLSATAAGALDLDPLGWGSFLGLGYCVEDRTLLRDVWRVPPASITVYDAVEGRPLARSTYWRWPAPRAGLRLEQVDTGALIDLLTQNVHAYREHVDHAGTLLLSGGFDSRLVLGAVLRAGARPRTIALSHALAHDDANGRFAVRVARGWGLPVSVIAPTPGFHSSAAYLDYLVASEISAPSLGLFIAQLGMHVRPEMKMVWEGLAPGYSLKTPHQPPGGFAAMLAQEAELPGARRWQAAARVFAPGVVHALEEGFMETLRQARARYADDGFGVSEFLVRSRMRNRTAPNPLKIYGHRVLPFTPGLSKAFWTLAGGIPYELKERFHLILTLFRRHFPEALRVPFVSGETIVPEHSGLDPRYQTALAQSRIMRVRYVAGVLRRAGLRPPLVREESAILERTLARVELDHRDLDPDAVRTLRSPGAAADPVVRTARELLFYWQVWRWTMDGSIHHRYGDLLGAGPSH